MVRSAAGKLGRYPGRRRNAASLSDNVSNEERGCVEGR